MTTSEESNKLLIDFINHEKKKDRFWRNIRFFVSVIIVLILAIALFSETNKTNNTIQTDKPYATSVNLSGAILPGSKTSEQEVLPLLESAFSDEKAKGVYITINSPGGSATQASEIRDDILYLKKHYNKKVIVKGEDMLTSGAYLIATAADKIYINKNTITGSIGVIINSFGFSNAIEKIGVERRIYTSGKFKDRLDPFQPATSSDIKKIQSVLDKVHSNFIEDVKESRGDKLNTNNDQVFSGDFWVGDNAVKQGLVDDIATRETILKQEFDVEQTKLITAPPSLINQITGSIQSSLHLPDLNEQSNILLLKTM